MGKYGTVLICSNEIDVTRTGREEEGSEKSAPLVNEVDEDGRMSPISQKVGFAFSSRYHFHFCFYICRIVRK